MFRWFFVSVLLSACGVAAVWLLVPHLISAPPAPSAPVADDAPRKPQAETPPEPTPPPSRRRSTSTATRGQTEVYVYRNTASRELNEPIIIPDGTLVIVEKQEVASEKEGILLFIGTDVLPNEVVPPEKQLPDAQLGFLAIKVNPADPVREGEVRFPAPPPEDDKTLYRRLFDKEQNIRPLTARLFTESRKVRLLQVGDRVKRGQLLAMVNPSSAFDDVAVKLSKLDGVEWERISAMKQKEEMYRKWDTASNLRRNTPGAISKDDAETLHVQFEKFQADENVKKQEIGTARCTLNDALTKLRQHEIRAAINGVIKVIYKNHQGDAVKPFEAILQIQNPARLRVEGRLEQQEAEKLKEGMTANVEASRPESPKLVLTGHLGPVNCVAVSKGKRPVIVSGSDDETLRGWDSVSGDKLWEVFPLFSSVRCVVCTPPACKRNLACFGCGDGTVRLFDLDNPSRKPREMSERHRGPVHGVAFSPDGEVIATCGEDHSIRLWKTETGDLLHTIVNAHSGSVTSVQFATAKRLVSAGKDNRLAIWDVEEGRPPAPEFALRGPRRRSNDSRCQPRWQNRAIRSRHGTSLAHAGWQATRRQLAQAQCTAEFLDHGPVLAGRQDDFD